MKIATTVPTEGTQSVDIPTKKLRISNTNKQSNFGDHIERNPNINDRNITGFCIVFGFFVAGLLTNLVIAQKIIALGPFVLPASVFIWALTFPCSDIAAEVYGRKYAHKLVLGGFIGYAGAMLVFLEAVAMPPAEFWPHQEAFETVLGSSVRVMLAALTVYIIAQFFDVHIFGYIRRKTKGKHLWLRNNLSNHNELGVLITGFLGNNAHGKLVAPVYSQPDCPLLPGFC